jgi:hypothetical protein
LGILGNFGLEVGKRLLAALEGAAADYDVMVWRGGEGLGGEEADSLVTSWLFVSCCSWLRSVRTKGTCDEDYCFVCCHFVLLFFEGFLLDVGSYEDDCCEGGNKVAAFADIYISSLDLSVWYHIVRLSPFGTPSLNTALNPP